MLSNDGSVKRLRKRWMILNNEKGRRALRTLGVCSIPSRDVA